MKTTVYKSDFRQAFKQADRYDQYGYEALGMLFEYLEELEADMREEFELDVISLCCDWDINIEKYIRSYYDIPEDEDLVEYLSTNTQYIGMTSDQRHLYMAF
tara:strand:- start:158 stop:463 length:306 start_codon:yes stop_codon:yes gene_type:complete